MPDNSNKKSSWWKWLILVFFVSFLVSFCYFFLGNQPKIAGGSERINLVFLGINGGNYQPPDLTDTIMLLSYNRQSGKTAIFSIPRDLWVPSIRAKINSAYHYGGFDFADKVIEEVTGQPVHYFFVLDFEGFEKAVDFLGGLQIEVENSFDDYKFPIAGKENDECGGDKEYQCRYEHVHFEKGIQLMNGKTALKYVRSRNAEGDEGTDTARNARQQKFLAALKKKIFSPEVLLNPQKIIGLAKIFSSSVVTNLQPAEYFSFGIAFWRFQSESLKMVVLGKNAQEELFIHPLTHPSGQWVLVPKNGSWEKVKEFVRQEMKP